MRAWIVVSYLAAACVAAHAADLQVGAARVDVTPATPIRLSGYAARTAETTRVEQHLFARALAIGETRDSAVVIVTIDAIGLPASVCEAIAKLVFENDGVPRERLAFCATHSHTAPHLANLIPNMFGADLPADQAERIDRYTDHVIAGSAQAVHAAVGAMRPGALEFARGRATFAANRRAQGGPVDHDVPLLIARDSGGAVIATLAAYACHCTTLAPGDDFVCGDWAGYAAEGVERGHEGAVALIAIGCAGDQNPTPRTGLDHSKAHGAALAAEIERLLATTTPTAITGGPESRFARFDLPLAPPRTRDQWLERRALGGAVGHHATHFLGMLDRGETIPTTVPYVVQSIHFGDELAMVFLAGEVVVDYALRLKRELRAEKLFLAAYANALPCYIPSRRVLAEGGYEAEGAMTYYGHPNRLANECEDRIVREVREQLPSAFVTQTSRAEFPPPPSPSEALAALVPKEGFRVELAAAEPLVESPVAIDFAADGSLYVVEMRDYPSGMTGELDAGGRVKKLFDDDRDGAFDSASVFLEGLPFPTGCLEWGDGLFVCAAPDILFARDTDDDGVADRREVWITGFSTENEQARPNSLVLGLDGWIYGAGGLIGGTLTASKTGEVVAVGSRNFRFHPQTGAVEALVGISQQGLARDEFGAWFGCDSNIAAYHFPLEERYLALNPFVAPPPANQIIVHRESGDPREVFPLAPSLERFNDYDHANRVTSACGIEVYRDDAFGAEYRGDLFVCEPVHDVVLHLDRVAAGSTYRATRPTDEPDFEFLASRSNWFKPVSAKTGPDGALWIVDMARFLVEHPRWVSAERLATIDIRAGADRGRIWRIVRNGIETEPIPNLETFSELDLVAELASPHGAARDRAMRELMVRPERSISTRAALRRVAREGPTAGARVAALHTLAAIGDYDDATARFALNAGDVDQRIVALRLAEANVMRGGASTDRVVRAIEACADTTDQPRLARQMVGTLGLFRDRVRGVTLVHAIRGLAADAYGVSAALGLAPTNPIAGLRGLEATPLDPQRRDLESQWIDGLCATALGTRDPRHLSAPLSAVLASAGDGTPRFDLLSRIAAVSDAIGVPLALVPSSQQPGDLDPPAPEDRAAVLSALFESASRIVADPGRDRTLRIAAAGALCRSPGRVAEDIALLAGVLYAGEDPDLDRAAIERLVAIDRLEARRHLIAALRRVGPTAHRTIVDSLLERESGCRLLLVAIEEGTAQVSDCDASQRDRLLAHATGEVAAAAARIFGPSPRVDAELAALRPALALQGAPPRGAAYFDVHCASCHSFRGRGQAVGADLAALTDRTPGALLAAIVDPNAAVDARYQAYAVETRDGRALLGAMVEETRSSISLLQQSGGRESVLRDAIRSLRATGRSLMPEGLLAGATHQEVADLLAYLATAPRRFEAVDDESGARARAELARLAPNGCAQILDGMKFESQPSWLGRIPMRYCRQTTGRSRVSWRTTPVPSTLDAAGRWRFRLPVAMGFISMPAGGFTLFVEGREALRFDVATTDFSVTRPDGAARLDFYVHAHGDEDATGVLTLEVDASWLKRGEGALLEVVGGAASSERWFGVLEPPSQ